MLTSSRNWSSGSARHALPAPEARRGRSNAAGAQRQQQRGLAQPLAAAKHRTSSPAPALALAQDRLGFGEHVRAVVERLDILDGDRPGELALVGGADRDRDVAAIDLGIDRDRLLQRDRILDALPSAHGPRRRSSACPNG